MDIKENDKQFLLSLTPDDLTFEMLVKLFADSVDENGKNKPSWFNTTDTFTLRPNEYFVKEITRTTVGRFIYNKYIVERCKLQDVLGYVNYAITDSKNGGIEAQLSKALIKDEITVHQFHQYIDARDNLGMSLNSVITTSFTPKTISILPEVEKRKNELFKKYDKELNKGDIFVSERIEKELTSMSKELLKGDPGLDLYDSEARGNFGNYKNMMLFKGATMNNITGEYEIVRSSFMDGIRKEDIPSFATAVVSGAYPKAVGTQESGYLAKQLLAFMQTEVLDDEGTDCKSPKTLEVKLTPKNAKEFQYRYIVEGNKLVELTDDVIKTKIGTTVHMRSPMYCQGDKICNVCAGNLNYKLGNKNIGLGCSAIANVLLRLGMKAFHTANIASKPIDINDMLI